MKLDESGINVVARLNEHSGTSIAARAVVDVLQRAGIPLAYFQLPLQPEARNGNESPLRAHSQGFLALPYRTMLFLDLPFIVDDIYASAADHLAAFRTGTVLYWEVERLPAPWHATYRRIDVPFAPSTLVRNALYNSLGFHAPMVPVVPLDRGLMLKKREPGRPFTFFMNFDIMSSLARKNPKAPIDAFIEAFGDRSDVRLIVKIWEFEHSRIDRAPIEELERRYPSITHVFDDLSYEETRALIASSDAYVSLHRSEGLGLGMLEAMSAGVPVIATDYGGNADYLDASCGFPVPYTLASTEGSDKIYSAAHVGVPTSWGDPDVAYAAGAMEQIVADTRGYNRLCTGARRRYEERLTEFRALNWLEPLYNPCKMIETFRGDVEAPWKTVR